MQKAGELKSTVSKNIHTKCTDRTLKLANFVTVGVLCFATFMRILYTFGIGASTTVTVEAAEPADLSIGDRRLAETSGGGFNFFFFLNSMYLTSFVALYTIVSIKPDHKYGVMARIYFHFLNPLVGKGWFLVFLGLILLE
jgi:hypothetical protein